MKLIVKKCKEKWSLCVKADNRIGNVYEGDWVTKFKNFWNKYL